MLIESRTQQPVPRNKFIKISAIYEQFRLNMDIDGGKWNYLIIPMQWPVIIENNPPKNNNEFPSHPPGHRVFYHPR